jgi:alkylated DNA repair protein (DNA oxidative demethylase)
MAQFVNESVMDDLVSTGSADDGRDVRLGANARVLRGFALAWEGALVVELDALVARSPFRHMLTPGGFRMSVAMTNCGAWGWVSEPRGYR